MGDTAKQFQVRVKSYTRTWEYHSKKPQHGMGPSCGSLLSLLRAAVPERSGARKDVAAIKQNASDRLVSSMMSATCDGLLRRQVASLQA